MYSHFQWSGLGGGFRYGFNFCPNLLIKQEKLGGSTLGFFPGYWTLMDLGLLGASPEAAAIGSATSRCTLALRNSTNKYIHRSLANKIA